MGASVRGHIESLIAGESGTTRVMDSRFRRKSSDAQSLEHQPVDSCERRFEVRIPPGGLLHPINPLSGRKWRTHDMLVRVSYALTNAGGDNGEALGEQSGGATVDKIYDRMDSDATDLESVLVWHENRAGTDPVIVALYPSGSSPSLVLLEDRLIVELRYTMVTQATLPGFYAP